MSIIHRTAGCSRPNALRIGAVIIAAALLATTAIAQSNPGVGVPAKLPRPISGIVPSKVPPLQRPAPKYPNTGAPHQPTFRPGDRPGHRPAVVFPPGFGWRYDRPHDFRPDFGDPANGSSVSGSVGTDHWRVKFRVGSPVIERAKNWYWWRYPYWGHSHWCWWNDYPRYAIGGYWDYTDQFLDYAGQVQYQQTADQQAQQEKEERERFARLSELEKGDYRLSERNAKDAIAHYLKHLETATGDAEAMRSLAVALMDDNQIDKACAMMALAYDRNPALVRDRMAESRFPGSATELRDRLTSIVTYANRTGTASAWLTATVIAQAEKRDSAATNMLNKAKAAGLKPELVKPFEQHLGGN